MYAFKAMLLHCDKQFCFSNLNGDGSLITDHIYVKFDGESKSDGQNAQKMVNVLKDPK